MTSDAVTLPPEARSRVDAYLDAIEEALERSGRPRGERRGITDEVEAQILEMLAARGRVAPTVDDVEAVLADLDPPEAYAQGPTEGRSAAAAAPRVSSQRWWLGVVSLALCVVGFMAAAAVAQAVAGLQHLRSWAFMAGYLVFLGLEVAALVCGILGWRASPMAKAGAIASPILIVLSMLGLA